MRKSREEAAETRKRIVTAAACEFRKNGIVATGLERPDEGRRTDPRRLLQALRVEGPARRGGLSPRPWRR